MKYCSSVSATLVFLVAVPLEFSIAHGVVRGGEKEGAVNALLRTEEDESDMRRLLQNWKEFYVKAVSTGLTVYKTTRDEGIFSNTEQWSVRFTLTLHDTSSGHQSTEASADYTVPENFDGCLLLFGGDVLEINTRTKDTYNSRYRVKVWGEEQDSWPNPDDPLPTCYSNWIPNRGGGRNLSLKIGPCEADDRRYSVSFDILEGGTVVNPLPPNPFTPYLPILSRTTWIRGEVLLQFLLHALWKRIAMPFEFM